MTLASLYSVGEDGVLKSRGTGCRYNIIRKGAHGDRGGLRLYKKKNQQISITDIKRNAICKSLNI